MAIAQTNCIGCGEALTTIIISNAGQLCNTCAQQGFFRKRIIITGITRMNGGNICVSGIDTDTWKFVRPVFSTGLHRNFTMEGTTQVINHFNLVEIEFKKYSPNEVYHTEDWIINETIAPKFISHLTNEEIINVLNRMAISDLNAAMIPQDKSLFIVKAQQITRIWEGLGTFSKKFEVRLDFIDFSGRAFHHMPVNDLLTLAFVRYQLERKNNNYRNELMNAFNNNPYRYIRIGLTRKFIATGEYHKQVTALITVPDLFSGESFSYYEKKLGGQV